MSNTNNFFGFNILHKLGHGAFSTTYLAEQNENRVAIKVIEIPNPTTSKAMSSDDLLSEEFQFSLRQTCSELNKILRTLVNIGDRKGILRYYDYRINLEKNTGVYKLAILSEYVESLPAYAQKNDFTVGKVIKMAVDLCEGLEVMWQRNIPHGNIKESNIFYSPTKGFKLGDFYFNDVLINTLKPRESYSNYGYRFLAPEAYNIDDCSYKTDIFALAMLVYKILNNSLLPYEKEFEPFSPKIIREKFIDSKILPPSSYIHPLIYDILRKATSFNENDRYENFSEMSKAFKEALKKIDFETTERIIKYKPQERHVETIESLLSSPEPEIKEPTASFEIKINEEKTNEFEKQSDVRIRKPSRNIPESPAQKERIKNNRPKRIELPSFDEDELTPLYSYYDEDPEDDEKDKKVRNWIFTVAFFILLIAFGIFAVITFPYITAFFSK